MLKILRKSFKKNEKYFKLLKTETIVLQGKKKSSKKKSVGQELAYKLPPVVKLLTN